MKVGTRRTGGVSTEEVCVVNHSGELLGLKTGNDRAFILNELVQSTEGLACKKKDLFGSRKQQYFSLLDLRASLEQDRHCIHSCDSAYTEGLSAYLSSAGEAGVLEHGKWTGLHETSA